MNSSHGESVSKDITRLTGEKLRLTTPGITFMGYEGMDNHNNIMRNRTGNGDPIPDEDQQDEVFGEDPEEEALDESETDEDVDEGTGDGNIGRSKDDLFGK